MASLRKFIPVAFVLIPITYSIDNDPYRTWEVLFWAGSACALGLMSGARLRMLPEAIIIISYAGVLIFQQLFIPSGRIFFGLQYAIVFTAAFIPWIIMRSIKWDINEFGSIWDRAVKILSIIVILNIFGGRIFGWGESYFDGASAGRYFGFLGDSISPVILFPLIYFILERRYGWSAIMLSTILLTGGKAAIVLLLLAPPVMALSRLRLLGQTSALLLIMPLAFFMEPIFDQFISLILYDHRLSYSFNTRILSFELGWYYFLSSPIWGLGINQSMIVIEKDADALAYHYGMIDYYPVEQVHNAFVRALAETGILGFSVLVCLSVLLVFRGLRSLRKAAESAPSQTRSLVIASGIWTVLFVVGYQSTGWFEHGHPQFAWVLMLSFLSVLGAKYLLPSPAPSFWLRSVAHRSPTMEARS